MVKYPTNEKEHRLFFSEWTREDVLPILEQRIEESRGVNAFRSFGIFFLQPLSGSRHETDFGHFVPVYGEWREVDHVS